MLGIIGTTIATMIGYRFIETQIKNRKDRTMAEKKFNKVSYVYGNVYRAYLDSGKSDHFLLKNVRVREWGGILYWMKKNNYIQDFVYGDTLETAGECAISGFNEEDKIYTKYLNAIEKNFLNEQVA